LEVREAARQLERQRERVRIQRFVEALPMKRGVTEEFPKAVAGAAG
jgi:hypothetical protein